MSEAHSRMEKPAAAVTSARSKSPQKPPPHTSGRPSLLLIAGGVSVIVVIALALGLGLGLGLRNRNSSSDGPSSSSATSGAPSGTPLPGSSDSSASAAEPWRLDTSQYLLSKSWDLNAEPTTRYFNFTISQGQGWPDGVVRDMLFINGQFPGPLIEVNRGDRLVINVTNHMSNSTALHWHGLYQNGTNWYDGTIGVTQCGIAPNSSFVYNFTIENQFGTFWYHSHANTQYLDGLVGPLIVHAPEEADVRKLYDHDQIVMVQDWYHDFSTVNLATYEAPANENSEPVPDNGLVNGRGYFNCSSYAGDSSGYTCFQNSSYAVLKVDKSSRTRFRLINTGALAEFDFSVDNHSISVIEADATLVNPHSIHRVPFHVAQRYSVVVEANQSASTNYWIRSSMNTFCFTGENKVLDPTTLAVLSYSGNTSLTPSSDSLDWQDALPTECVDLDASDLVPSTKILPPAANKLYRVDFSFGEGDYQLEHALVNGTKWQPLSNTTTLLQAQQGLNDNFTAWDHDGQVGMFASGQFVVGLSPSGVDVVDILVNSLDEGSHPFHLHGHSFWILQTGSGPFNWTNYYTNIMPSKPEAVQDALRRDTMTINPYGWSLIRIVADNPGLWAFHCHIAWHMQIGLLMQFMSRPDIVKGLQVPSDVTALCTA